VRRPEKFLSLCIGLMLTSVAYAQESMAIKDALQELLAMSEQQCKQAEARDEREKATMDLQLQLAAENMRNTICQCTPNRIRELAASLPPEELARRVSTPEELQAIVRTKVIDRCAGDQLTRQFTHRCPEKLKNTPVGFDAVEYCSCMSSAVDAIPDGQIGELGLKAATYIPSAAAAKKRGEPLPPMPVEFEPLLAAHEKCGKGRLPNPFKN
jgi:hypothetical protein